MIRALRTLGQHLWVLSRDTLVVWWRCLPALLAGLSLGLLGYHVLLVLSAFISASHPWLAVATLSVGFACLLVGYLYCLRSLGRQLAVGEAILRTDQGDNLVDEPLSRLVALTLLPFIGIYAVFGKMQQTSGQLVTYEVVTRGVFEKGVLTTLNPTTGRQMLVVLAVLLVAFVLRRSLDGLLERTERRVFGILTGLVETFFTLVLIYGGTRVVNRGKDWLASRRVATWWHDALSLVARVLRRIDLGLPELLARLWQALLGPVWHVLSQGLAQPLLWLAIAALAFGSRSLSATELWRATLGGRATSSGWVATGRSRMARVPLDRLQQPGVQRAWTETKELLLGDLDDKYLPTLQTLRLVLSAGLSLIGAFCLLHALVQLLGTGSNLLLQHLVGPRRSVLWVALAPGQDLVETLLTEPLRLSLLAVTYLRCLHLLLARTQQVQHG